MKTNKLIKWVGGKSWLAPSIKVIIESLVEDKQNSTYYEPFAGGLAVLDELGLLFRDKIIGDVNRELIWFYIKLSESPYRLLQTFNDNYGGKVASPTWYLDERAVFNRMLGSVSFAQAARFYFLNHNCYRGLWRVNKLGEFNVPYGNYNKVTTMNEDLLLLWYGKLTNTWFQTNSYERTLETATKYDVAYLDPPYYGQYGGYSNEVFDHNKFFDFVDGLSCPWVMSNTDSPEVRDRFKRHRILTVIKPTGMENKQVRELLIIKK